MKKVLFTSLSLFALCQASAQWLGTNPVYFNAGNVGIGTATPAVWFGGSKTFEFSDTRPVFKLSSTSLTGLSTIVFTNSNVNTTSHGGEFHLNYHYNSTNSDKSNITFHGYPGGSALAIQADGNVAVQDNRQLSLRGLNNNDTGLKFDSPTETVRISHTKDIYDRYISLGGYSSGTWSPQMVVNTKTGNVGIGTAVPGSRLAVVGAQSVEESVVNVTNASDQDFIIRLSGAGAAIKRTIIGPSTANRFSLGVGLTEQLTMVSGGNVGIGTANPNQKLTVNGTIYGKEVKVDLSVPGPDYVFADNYQLPTLNELKTYIDQNKHLPEVPSAKEMEANGINLGEMNMLLLKKIEELTLFIINQQRQIDSQRKQIDQIKGCKN